MSWTKLLANKTVTALPPTKEELDKLRALAARSLNDVAVPGLSMDMQFILAYDVTSAQKSAAPPDAPPSSASGTNC